MFKKLKPSSFSGEMEEHDDPLVKNRLARAGKCFHEK